MENLFIAKEKDKIIQFIEEVIGYKCEKIKKEINNGVVVNQVCVFLAKTESVTVDFDEIKYFSNILWASSLNIEDTAVQIKKRLMDLWKKNLVSEPVINKERILKNTRKCVINYELNKERLERLNIVYKRYLDFAIVYRVFKTDEHKSTKNSDDLLISYDHLTKYELTEEALELVTDKNKDKFLLIQLKTIMEQNCIELVGENFLTVGTNAEQSYGAGILTDLDKISKYSIEHDTDLIIFPSSVHEVLFLEYEDNHYNRSMLNNYIDTVKTINATQVDQEDFLSNHIYLYKRDDYKLHIIE